MRRVRAFVIATALLGGWALAKDGGSADAGRPPADRELIENLELLQNLELAKDLELMQELSRQE